MIELEASEGRAGLGRVVQAGARAESLLGRRVLVGPIDPCGECEICRRGGAPVCPHARHRAELGAQVVAAARWVVPLGDGLELPVPAGAAVAGTAVLAYTLYARTGAAPREPVVVVGAAPVTRFLIEILLAKGIAPIVVADPAHVAWCAWLEGKGVTLARTTEASVAAATIAATLAAQGLGARPVRVIATTADTVTLGAHLAGPRATLTVLAPIAGLPGELAAREVTVICVAGAHPDLVVEVAAMCVKGEIDLVSNTSLAANTTLAPDDELRALVIAR